jgi:hypothetical protein
MNEWKPNPQLHCLCGPLTEPALFFQEAEATRAWAPVAEGSAGREHAAEEGVGRRRKGMTGCSFDRRMAVILALLRHGAGP